MSAWWAARTSRERRVLEIAAVFVLAVLLPLWAYLGARTYRAEAADELARALALEADIGQLRAAGAISAGATGADAAEARAASAAAQAGLTVARVETSGQLRARVIFEAADSVRVYQWVAAAARQGLAVNAARITRTGQGDLVNAEFEVESQ